MQGKPATCNLVKRCPTLLAGNSIPYAGGTGYDPRFQAVWSSDGLSIELRELRNCKRICSGKAILAIGGRVSGLAVNDTQSRLYQLETRPGQYAITVYDIRSVKTSCFKAITRCVGRMATPNGVAGGLAYDESRRLLYISMSERTSAGGAYQHFIAVALASNPCKIVCRKQIPTTCLSRGRVVTGLGYDDCKPPKLYATDGAHHLEMTVLSGTGCNFAAGRCCNASGPYRGLAVIPGWTLRHIGKPCASRPCKNCPNMHAATSGGDPSLGNPNFALQLVDAPAGPPAGIAGLFIRVGGCTGGFPLFCGKFYAAPGFGPFVLPVTGTGCSGKATMPLPIPPINGLCGLKLCAQWIVVCPSATSASGVGLSDAIEFTIAGS